MPIVSWGLLESQSWEVAPRLLGSLLVREYNGQLLVGRIVETEAYDQADVASHSFYGRSGRAAVTFGPAGHLYVHAMRQHFGCDITTGLKGHGSSVLIRAIEPLEGEEIMTANRHGAGLANLTNGPAKLCQALAIDHSLNDHDLRELPLQLFLQPALSEARIAVSPRIGISKGVNRPWRFYVKGSPFVSKTA